jgi:pyruvate/2-oxoglutarate dehydrogenase complex dihydrolipoamide dehydrogenase (E3) component
MERVQSIVKKIAPHNSIERYTNLGVNYFSGFAKILSPNQADINGKILTTKNIIIATGAKPTILAIPGLNKVKFLTTDNLWNIRELPKRFFVLGGGPIGAELSRCFARLGSKVTLIEMIPNILIR